MQTPSYHHQRFPENCQLEFERCQRSKTISGCAAKYARALSTETTTAANSLKYLLWVARFFVLRQRYSMGLSSGEYDGKGCSVIRSLRAAKKACVDALV